MNSIPFLPKEAMEEWSGTVLEGCNALIQEGASWGSTSSMIMEVLAKCEWSCCDTLRAHLSFFSLS